MPKKPVNCCLCGKPIKGKDPHSTFRIEGECRGFSCSFDLQRAFHNDCLTREKGVNEIARAQVLDYIESVQFNDSVLEDLRNQNLTRARKIVKQIEWRSKYDGPKA